MLFLRFRGFFFMQTNRKSLTFNVSCKVITANSLITAFSLENWLLYTNSYLLSGIFVTRTWLKEIKYQKILIIWLFIVVSSITFPMTTYICVIWATLWALNPCTHDMAGFESIARTTNSSIYGSSILYHNCFRTK